MKELFPARDSLVNKISYYHLLLFLACLPFDRFYSHIILISFIIHTLIHFNRQQVKPVFTLSVLVLQSVFFVTVFSTFYAVNKSAGYSEWGKQITVLLFPLVFCLSSFDLKKYRPSLLLGFSLVCAATIAYLYFDAIHIIRHYKLPFSTIFSTAFVNHNFSEPINIHATFLSMQVVIALVYLLSVLIKEKSLNYKVLYITCIFFLFAGVIQLCSKSVFICLFLAINLVIPFFLLDGHKRRNFMIVTASVSIILIAGIFKSGTFRERYISDLKSDLTESTIGESSESRLARWQVTGELISIHPITGYGAGSEVGLLQKAFYERKYYSSFLHQLNAHNQYLSFLLKSGIIGLLIYIATLIAGFRMAIKRKDPLFFTFMLLIAIVSASENILDVDKGIIFYAFFFSFFTFSSQMRGRGQLTIKKLYMK